MKRARSTLNANLLSGERVRQQPASNAQVPAYVAEVQVLDCQTSMHYFEVNGAWKQVVLGCTSIHVSLACGGSSSQQHAPDARCLAVPPIQTVFWKPAAADVSNSPDRRVPIAARGKYHILLLQLGAFETSMDVNSQEAQLGHPTNSLAILEVSHPLGAPV